MGAPDLDRKGAAAAIAGRMAAAAAAWLEALDPEQRAAATGEVPGGVSDGERQRWFYTPTDHGGLTLGAQRPAQQRLAHALVATGLSTAGYVTVATIIGLENVLDHAEGWSVNWGRERGRDPGLYYLRVFGEPGGTAPWGWRFGGHHVSLNNLITGAEVRAVTPCFLGADPAVSPLLGAAPLRPLGGAEDLARELMRSLGPGAESQATLLSRAPSDIIGGNRARLADGDQMIHLPDLWERPFTEPGLARDIARADAGNESATGYDGSDHARLALSAAPKGLPARELEDGQRHLLRRLLAAYLGRVPAACRRCMITTMTTPWTPCTWPGPGRWRPASRSTTGCRAPGCSSSTTTCSGGPTTRTRCGVTRSPTSASTCWPRTGPRTTTDGAGH